ncbi:MAG: hypothetical protein AAF611_01800 [Bacteroidota bacterium]
MKKSVVFIFIFLLVLGCTNDSANIQEEMAVNYSLVSPDNVILAESYAALNQQMTNGNGNVIDVEYVETNNTSLIAKIKYTISDITFETYLLRNVSNVQFPKDAIIQLPSKINNDHNFYVSCSGRTCCAPTGTYNPNTQLFTTACKCDDNNNSSCVMRVSSTPPKGQEIDEN